MMAFLKGFDIDPRDQFIKEGMNKCRELMTGMHVNHMVSDSLVYFIQILLKYNFDIGYVW